MTPTISCCTCGRNLVAPLEIFQKKSSKVTKDASIEAQMFGENLDADLSPILKDMGLARCCTTTILSRYDNTLEKYGVAEKSNRS